MPAIIAAAKAKLTAAAFPGIFSGGRRVTYEMDNASCHGATPPQLGLRYKDAVIEHPPRSPDFDRVVENTHHIVCSRYAKELQRRPHINTPQGYMDLFSKVARGDPSLGDPCVTVEATRANFEGLPELWKWVYEHRGQRPPKYLMH